mmetsp:Transcript_85169/g.183626  ORF Transcript_85169/g.183626 Transcript_85169/m.183626 type:complete len:210 (-) Transcript_85169:7-636(-)
MSTASPPRRSQLHLLLYLLLLGLAVRIRREDLAHEVLLDPRRGGHGEANPERHQEARAVDEDEGLAGDLFDLVLVAEVRHVALCGDVGRDGAAAADDPEGQLPERVRDGAGGAQVLDLRHGVLVLHLALLLGLSREAPRADLANLSGAGRPGHERGAAGGHGAQGAGGRECDDRCQAAAALGAGCWPRHPWGRRGARGGGAGSGRGGGT